MRILAIADRPPRKKIREILAEESVDLIVTLGDLEQFDLMGLDEVKDIPKLGVYGNHCSGMYFEPLGIKNMHLATFEYGGLLFGGFEGSVRYKQNPDAKMCTQGEADQLLENFPRVDVFLAHCPPYGINDEPDELAHQGFFALKKYLEEKQPRYFFHGHTYPQGEELVTKYLDTEIVYVYQDKIVEII